MQYNVGLGQNFTLNLDKQKFPAIYKCNHTSETTSDTKLIYTPNMMGVYHAIGIKLRTVKIGVEYNIHWKKTKLHIVSQRIIE